MLANPDSILEKKNSLTPFCFVLCIDVFWLRYTSECVHSGVNTTKQKWYYI